MRTLFIVELQFCFIDKLWISTHTEVTTEERLAFSLCCNFVSKFKNLNLKRIWHREISFPSKVHQTKFFIALIPIKSNFSINFEKLINTKCDCTLKGLLDAFFLVIIWSCYDCWLLMVVIVLSWQLLEDFSMGMILTILMYLVLDE